MSETNPIKSMTRRERRILIAALIVVPFFYPFLLVWFANDSFDKVYNKALSLPGHFRAIATSDDVCPPDLDKLKESADKVLHQCVGALPYGSDDPLKSRHLLGNLEFLPLFGRGVLLWHQVGKVCDVPEAIWSNPEKNCQQAGKNLHQAAADLEAALNRYGQTRILMQVLLYVWLVAEVFGWIIVIIFTRRYLRERAAAKASSSSK